VGVCPGKVLVLSIGIESTAINVAVIKNISLKYCSNSNTAIVTTLLNTIQSDRLPLPSLQNVFFEPLRRPVHGWRLGAIYDEFII